MPPATNSSRRRPGRIALQCSSRPGRCVRSGLPRRSRSPGRGARSERDGDHHAEQRVAGNPVQNRHESVGVAERAALNHCRWRRPWRGEQPRGDQVIASAAASTTAAKSRRPAIFPARAAGGAARTGASSGTCARELDRDGTDEDDEQEGAGEGRGCREHVGAPARVGEFGDVRPPAGSQSGRPREHNRCRADRGDRRRHGSQISTRRRRSLTSSERTRRSS